jgi:hypothetical protein
MKLRDKAGMTKFYVKYNSTETGEPVNRASSIRTTCSPARR